MPTTSPSTGWWTRTVQRHGWRAYAVLALALVTVVVLLRPGGGGDDTPAAAPAAASASASPSAPTSAPAHPAAVETLSSPTTLPPTPDPADARACAGNTDAQLILVNIGAQHAWMCNGTALALSTPVTTGALVDDRQTRVGSWRIQAKQADRDLTGPGYVEHVDFWMPYDGDFGLHDSSWQTFAYGTEAWKTDGSHGCVHLPHDAMAWVYGWAQVGARVTITA